MNPINNSSSSYQPVVQENSDQTRKRPRSLGSFEQGRPSKRMRKAVKLDSLPFDIMEHVCSFLKLPDWIRLGLASKCLFDVIEWQSIWRHLNRENHMGLPQLQPLTEFSGKVCQSDPAALRACSDLYIKGKDVDKDFGRALQFLERLRANSQSKEEQANVELEIAWLHVRYSPDADRFIEACSILENIQENEEFPKETRVQACFLMLRIYIYYSPYDPDEEIFEMVNEAYRYLIGMAELEDTTQAVERDLLRVLLLIRTHRHLELAQGLLIELKQIHENANVPSFLRQEAHLFLAVMCAKGIYQDLTHSQAFTILRGIAEDKECLPEVSTLAKYFMVEVDKHSDHPTLTKEEINAYLNEVSDSPFIAQKYMIMARFAYAHTKTLGSLDSNEANQLFQKFQFLVNHVETSESIVDISKYEMAKLAFMHDIEGVSDEDLYQLLCEVNDSPYLSQQCRWLIYYYIVIMNMQRRAGIMLNSEIVRALHALLNVPDLPESLKRDVGGRLADFMGFTMDDDL